MSDLLGVGSPLGWLWISIILEEFDIIAVLKISEGAVFKELLVPIEIIDKEVIYPFESKVMQVRISLSELI